MYLVRSDSENVESRSMLRMDDVEECPTFPECRLWQAVIIHTIDEYEGWLKRIQANWLRWGQPVDRAYYHMLQTIRHETAHAWFAHICCIADIPQSRVLKKFSQLDKQYGLINVVFDNESARVLNPLDPHSRQRRRVRKFSYSA